MTPREAALDFIRPYVERGVPLSAIKRRLTGRFASGTRVQLGGYVWDGDVAERLSRSEVAVTELDGQPCRGVFELRSLYRELYLRQQPTLFDEPARGGQNTT